MNSQNKKAAIELSIGTIVVVVLAMTMLILGLVLVRTIFSGTTESVNTLSDKVRGEITGLFAEEGNKIAIRLGADKIAKVKAGTENFAVAFGGQTAEGELVNDRGTTNLWYRLELTNDACPNFANYVLDHTFGGNKFSEFKQFEDTDAQNGYSRLVFNIPDGTRECTQSVKIHTYKADKSSEIASSSFRVQVIAGGIFS